MTRAQMSNQRRWLWKYWAGSPMQDPYPELSRADLHARIFELEIANFAVTKRAEEVEADLRSANALARHLAKRVRELSAKQ